MTTHNSAGTLLVSIKNKMAILEFGHPASNSFPADLLARLTHEIQELATNPAVLILLIKSTGTGVFCAGASFDELLLISNQEQGTAFFSGFSNLINAMRTCPKLIVGRIQGKAIGGGVGIAAACDYVLATQEASIKLSELGIGIGPFVIEPAVSRKIGKTAFTQMTLAAHEWKTADWAKDKGLYASVFETIPALDNAVSDFCAQLTSYNPQALLEMKKVLWEDTHHWETVLPERAAISGKLVLSDFCKNALHQFKK